MDWQTKIGLGLIALLVLGVALLLWRLSSWKRKARQAAAEHTDAEVDGMFARAVDRERDRSDEEALEMFRENFSNKPGKGNSVK